MILYHLSFDLIIPTFFFHQLLPRSFGFFIVPSTTLNDLPPEAPSVHIHHLYDYKELPLLPESEEFIFFFVSQLPSCKRLLTPWPLHGKLFLRRLTSRKSGPYASRTVGLITMLSEDGSEALPVGVLALFFSSIWCTVGK